MKLIIRQRGDTTEFTPDANLGIIKVGRADSNDVTIKGEKAASREHFTLERTVDGWKLVDQVSANGTALNGEKVNFGFVKDGDLIQVGATTIQVTELDPAPGASPAPARRPRRVDVRGQRPRATLNAPEPGRANTKGRAVAPAPVANPERRNAPPKKSPVGALVGVGVIAFVLFIGGALIVNQASSTYVEPDQDVADRNDSREAELSEAQKDALSRANLIKSSNATLLKKIKRLETLQDELRGTRGSKAVSDISVMKSELIKQLDREVETHIKSELETVETGIRSGEYGSSIQRLADLDEYLAGDAYRANFGGAHSEKINEVRAMALKQNEAFIVSSYQTMLSFKEQFRFEDALEVCASLLTRAWLDADSRELYENERDKIVTMKHDHDIKQPVVVEKDEPEEDGSSILDKVKKDDGMLPGKNALLPNGRRSEQALVSALQQRMVKAAESETLTDNMFVYNGKTAKISGANLEKLILEVVHIDKRSGEELVFNTSVKWEKINPEDMVQLFDRTPELTDKDKLAMVIYCYDSGFTDQAAERAWQLFEQCNDWKEGIDTLIATKRKIKIPEGGFVEFDGALVTPDEKESAIFYRELDGVLERFEKGIGHQDRRKRDDGEKAFQELLEMGDRAVKPAVEVLQGVLDEEIANAKEATGLLAADGQRMGALLKELDKRREYALELIMDTVKYPYPYGPNKDQVQADVNQRVASVREIWNDPAKFTGQTNPNFDAIMTKIRELANRMAVIDPTQKYFKETPEDTVKYIENIANEDLSIKNYAGGDLAKEKLHNYNTKVLQHNKDFPTGEGHTDANGRAQVKITNEYRIMFGRVALKLNDKLFWAAWHHSKYCVQNNGGEIAHVIPGETRGEAPADRMKYEGYPGGGGENIHMNGGGPTPKSSHEAWCQSSGHHRNILAPQWRVLGSGCFKTIWTQNFGGADEHEDNSVSKGGE